MTPLITIQFGRSKSPSYQDILKYCRKFKNFTEGDKNELLIYDFDEISSRLYWFGEIVRIASNWKSFVMNYKDHQVKSPLNYETMIGNAVRCSMQKNKSNDPDYCKVNDKVDNWGCRMLRFIGKEPNDYALKWWYDFGNFTNGNFYQIDKEFLIKAINDEAKDKLCENCPFYDENNIRKQVSLLPDEIDIRDTVNWQVDFRAFFIGQDQVMLPVSIRHKDRFGRFPIIYEDRQEDDRGEFDFLTKKNSNPPVSEIQHKERISQNQEADRIIEEYLKNKKDAH